MIRLTSILALICSIGLVAWWVRFFTWQNINVVETHILLAAYISNHIIVVAIERFRKQPMVWVIGIASLGLLWFTNFRFDLTNTVGIISTMVTVLFYIFAILNSASHVAINFKLLRKMTNTRIEK